MSALDREEDDAAAIIALQGLISEGEQRVDEYRRPRHLWPSAIPHRIAELEAEAARHRATLETNRRNRLEGNLILDYEARLAAIAREIAELEAKRGVG